MALSTAQAAQIKTALEADAVANQELATAISIGNDSFVMAYCNAIASPDFWVWGSKVSIRDIYDRPSATGSFWNWGTFKSQSALEQTTWIEMFSDRVGYFHLQNFRAGVFNIFGGGASTAPGLQRLHIFACARKKATFTQKVLAVPVSSQVIDTGNDPAQPVGSAANPAVMTYEESISLNEVALILRPVVV